MSPTTIGIKCDNATALSPNRRRGGGGPRRHHREQAIQRAVVEHLRWRGTPGLVFLHPANGGWRSSVEAAIFRGLGVRPGAPDLLLWHCGKSYALELKAPGGRATEAQLQFLSDMRNAGVQADVAVGLDDALATLEDWRLLRGRVA